MKYAEIEVNKRFTIAVNDAEHRTFQLACVREGRAMSEVLRSMMREFAEKHSEKGKRGR
jgi:hypothetical protein